MRITGRREFDIASERLTELLLDLAGLAASAASVEEYEAHDDGSVSAVVCPRTSLGVTHFRLEARVEVDEHEPRRTVRYRIVGSRPENAMRMDVDASVEPIGPDRSELAWCADAEFFGVLAAVGQRALPGVVEQQLSALFGPMQAT